MKRILMVLVLLVTTSLVSVLVSVDSVYADEDGILHMSELGPKAEYQVYDFDGEVVFGTTGDPDGMGTGDGVDEDAQLWEQSTRMASDSTLSTGDVLFSIMSLVQLLGL